MSAQPVDVVEALAAWANEKDVGMAEWKRRAGIVDAVSELVEAGNVMRQIQMHTAPWYEIGQRQAYARLVGVPETSSRRTIEQAADDRFDAALARVSGGTA